VTKRTLLAHNGACSSLPFWSLTVWCVVCMLLLCINSFAAGKAAAAVAPRAVSRARCVRPYSLFGGLFGAKTADMGSAASKGGREGWAPSTGGPCMLFAAAAVATPHVLLYYWSCGHVYAVSDYNMGWQSITYRIVVVCKYCASPHGMCAHSCSAHLNMELGVVSQTWPQCMIIMLLYRSDSTCACNNRQ
jgi:hypothetical protein